MSRRYTRTAFLAALLLLMPALCAERLLAAGPEQVTPQGEDPPGADDGVIDTVPPSEHEGVIKPPAIGDEDIQTEVPNPDAGHDDEVIRPDELPKGDLNVDPR